MRSEYIDYSASGAYFITICTNEKKKIFWDMEKFNPEAVAQGFSEAVGAISNRPFSSGKIINIM